MENQIPLASVEAYVLGGKACVILYNIDQGTSIKFWVREKTDKAGNPTAWWIFTNSERTEYIGYIMRDKSLRLRYPDRETVSSMTAGIRAFEWFWPRVLNGTLPSNVAVLHNGFCGVCARPLSDPESLRVGIGPICRGDK